MEENTNMTNQATQTENMGNELEVQGAAAPEPEKGKLFTQEEVNSFVQSRISRMKSQITKEAQSEYNQKLTELQSREMRLIVREKLSDREMPKELADIITCTDENDIDSKLDALQKIYGDKAKKEKPTGFICVGGAPYEGNGRLPVGPDPIRGAMGLD